MTTKQAAEKLNLTPRHVRTLIEQGILPAEREETLRGAVFWVTVDDLETFKRKRSEQASVPGKRKPGRPLKLPPSTDDQSST